jgi:protein-S-isoprenylcysteine O-methyltransferase Ste14
MKELELLFAIILIVLGAIVFEMGQNYVEESMSWVTIMRVLGLVLLSAGVIIYLVAVDSLDEKKKKESKKKEMVLQILPLK